MRSIIDIERNCYRLISVATCIAIPRAVTMKKMMSFYCAKGKQCTVVHAIILVCALGVRQLATAS